MLLFGLVMVLMGAAFAVPLGAMRQRTIRDEDAPVLGASVLTLGLGTLNFLGVVWALVFGGEVGLSTVPFALAPLVAGWLGLRVTRRRVRGTSRRVLLVLAAVFTVAGLPGYFAYNVALLVTAIAAGAFIAGLVRNPRSLFRTLDPRV